MSKTGTTSIRAPSLDLKSHQTVLTQLKETTEIAQRLRGNPGDSFVKLSELIAAGIVNWDGSNISANKIKSGNASVAINVDDSITGDGSVATPLILAGDASAPGNLMLYGTNGSGSKGWYAIPGATIPLNTKGDLYGFTSAGARVPVGTDGLVLTADSTAAAGVSYKAVTAPTAPTIVGAAWSAGAGAVLTLPTNPVARSIPGTFMIKEVLILTEGGPGSCVINIWKANISSHYPPISSDDITGGASPTLSSGNTYQNSTLTGWTVSLAQDDVLLFTLASVSLFTFVSIQIRLG